MERVRDRRRASWFWMDKHIIDEYGKEIGPYGIALYAALARCADEHGQAIPSFGFLAKKLGMDRRSVMRHLAHLEDSGLIVKQTRYHENRFGQTSNLYILQHVMPPPSVTESPPSVTESPPSVTESPPSVTESPPSDLKDTPLVTQSHPPSDSDVPRTRSNEQDPMNKEENTFVYFDKSRNTRADYSRAFLSFWDIYPVKKGKGSAWRIWHRQKLNLIAEDIIQSVQDHVRSDVDWLGGKIKHPTTFLNGRCWEDELPDISKGSTKMLFDRLEEKGDL